MGGLFRVNNKFFKSLGFVFILAGIIVTGFMVLPTLKGAALTGNNFDPGHIIDDAVFTNSTAMSVPDIQNFLNAKMPSCDTSGTQSTSYYYNYNTLEVNNSIGGTWVTTNRNTYGFRYATWWNNQTSKPAGYMISESLAPYVCLKNFVENPSNGQTNLQQPTASIPGGESAAQIIYYAALQYNINPEVILTTLQKEQGLVTDDWPWLNEYTEAMGFNCPDTPLGCNGFAGFADQVASATRQYRNYINNPNNYNYVVGNNTIDYAPPSYGCAYSSVVDIANRATAALYDYTPYQPDSNVLARTNPTGSASGAGGAVSGDSCAAYGNRNFWWYFNTWFGSTFEIFGNKLATQSNYARSACNFSAYGPTLIERLYQPDSGDYFYTTSSSEACGSVHLGYIWDGVVMQSATGSNAVPVYRLMNLGRHYFTIDSTVRAGDIADGFHDEGVAFYAYSSVQTNSLPVYSLTDGPTTVLTSAGAEGQSFVGQYGYNSLGIAFYTPNLDSNGNEAVQRLARPNGERFYTIYSSEANTALSSGFHSEGPVSLDNEMPDVSNMPVYRISGPAGHFYTTNRLERDLAVINYGYNDEGAAFYTPTSAYPNSTSVYRSTNYKSDFRLYSSSLAEYYNSQTYYGYTTEGIGWYGY